MGKKIAMDIETKLKKKYKKILPFLNERDKRLVTAADAGSIGFGGITIVSRASGLSRVAITKGKKELKGMPKIVKTQMRIRKQGGGRKKANEKQKGINKELERLINPHTLGDPMSPLLWTSKSLRKLSNELKEKSYEVSYVTVGEILKKFGYSLQANLKTKEGKSHPDRDKQFEYINEQAEIFLGAKYPVISVDTKKKELIGDFKNQGKEWRPKKEPIKVKIYDFPSQSKGRAIPYGIYDIAYNEGWVNVGVDKDTAKFAVGSIRSWWDTMGKIRYSKTKKLLINADGGGSNSSRSRLWKKELQEFANQTGIEITVCHFPPGTSKWNKIEHRMFAHITMNWRGKPLTSHETVINLIGATKTKTGLKIKARLDKTNYEKGIKVSDDEMKKLNIKRHQFHGDWNYTILPVKM